MNKVVLPILIFALFLSGGTGHAEITVPDDRPDEQRDLIFISTARERRMGRNLDRKVREHFTEPVDPLLKERVRRIGAELAVWAERVELQYHFNVLGSEEDEVYNAFAAPGGYVYIFEDLAEELKTDDKIAAVLAHEMAHIEARHSIKRLQGSIGVTALLLLASQMQTERGSYARAHTAIGQLMAAYSREDEKEADELSVRYLRNAGYDPEASIEVLETLRRLRMEGPRRKYSPYRSHPYLSQRIAHLRQHIHGYMDFDSYINLPQEDEMGFPR